MTRTALRVLALVTALLHAAPRAAATPTVRCAGAMTDRRSLWLRDLHRGDELRLRPFRQLGLPCRAPWQAVTRFFRSRRGPRHTVAPELLRVLAQVQRHFEGRRLELLSGFRAPEDAQALSSYHQVGRAADVSIIGVPNRTLFEYCRSLQRAGLSVGCGLYPHGAHVHIDVRSRATTWVDLSGYGDGADYVADPESWLRAHPPAAEPSKGCSSG